MKKPFAALLSAGIILSAVPSEASALDPLHTESYDGVTYNFTVSGSNAELVSVSGAAGELTIPAELEGFSVTSVGEKAFFGNTAITSVKFPETLESIGENAFTGCSALENVDMPDSVASLGKGCFLSCTSLKDLRLSSSLSAIPDECFLGCNTIAAADMPENLRSVGERAFFNCPELKKIVLEAPGVTIGDEAFGYRYDLRSNSVTAVEGFFLCAKPSEGVLTYSETAGFPVVDIDTVPDGDADLNGTFSAADATAVLREYADLSAKLAPSFTAFQKKLSDLDKDGMLTSKDASLLLASYADSQKKNA